MIVVILSKYIGRKAVTKVRYDQRWEWSNER